MKPTFDDTTYFTKKKIIILSFSIVFFGLFIFFLYKFFFNIEFNDIWSLTKLAFINNKYFFLWFFLLWGFPVYNVVFRIYVYHHKLKKQNIYVEWYNWVIFSFITFLISSITPFAMGSEPYIIYWMKKRGLTIKESTSVVASFVVINPLMQIIITWPSFFIMCSSYGEFVNNQKWITSFWIVFVGLMLDLIGSIFWMLMSISKKAHYFISLLTNKIKKIFKLEYKNSKEIKEEYIKNSSFKKLFINQMKDLKFIIITSIGSLLWNIYYYSTLILSFNLIEPNHGINSLDLFNYVNVASTANNFVPIPGAEGTIQALLLLFIKSSTNISNDLNLENIINSSVVIWRTFTFYITTVIGAFFFLVLIYQEMYKNKIKSIKKKKNISNKTFTIIIPIDNDLNYLEQTIKTICFNNYDNEKTQIIVIDRDATFKNKEIVDQYLELYKNIDYFSFNFNNLSHLLNYINQNNLIKNEYVTFLEPGSFLNFNILESINMIINNEYDLYVSQYRIANENKKIKFKKRPYWFIFKKTIKNKNQMYSPKLNLFNVFVKKDILNSYFEIEGNFKYQMMDYFNFIIQKTKSIRYIKKINGNLFVNEYKWEEKNKKYFDQNIEIIKRCIKQKNPEIAIYNLKQKYTWNYIRNNNIKFYIDKKIEFKWIPFCFRWIYKIKFNLKYKNIFVLNNK